MTPRVESRDLFTADGVSPLPQEGERLGMSSGEERTTRRHSLSLALCLMLCLSLRCLGANGATTPSTATGKTDGTDRKYKRHFHAPTPAAPSAGGTLTPGSLLPPSAPRAPRQPAGAARSTAERGAARRWLVLNRCRRLGAGRVIRGALGHRPLDRRS